jgi:hypothetical protein
MTYQERVAVATSLTDLCATLNAIEEEIAATNTGSFTDSNIGEHVDIADLPTFGGAGPADTLGIWSWDADNLLYASGCSWSIEDRNAVLEIDPPASITDPIYDGSCDPLYGQLMDDAELGRN